MNMAKKWIAGLMVLALMLTAGCSQQSADSAAEIYMEKAQKYIDAKDYSAAIDILQLGMETVEDNALSEMLAEVIELQIAESNGNDEKTPDTVNTSFDLSNYVSEVTYWATESTNWVYGGYALGIYIGEEFGDSACFELSFIQAAPASRVAVAYAEVPLSEITGNEITFVFENDGWGHSGNVKLVFLENSVEFAVSNVAYTDPSCPEMWGFCDVTGCLINNPYVYDDLTYTQEEYDMLFGDDTTSEPTYDTSKASGILASLGMTEQEFKDSCIPLIDTDSYTNRGVTATNYAAIDDLMHYPTNYTGQSFVLSDVLWAKGICPYCNGSGDCQFTGSSYTTYVFENGQHMAWQYFNDILTPIMYRYSNRYTTDDGYQAYTVKVSEYPEIYCYVFDYRDDIYNPNITSDAKFAPYMIFLGVADNNKGLCFAMITCDVSFD